MSFFSLLPISVIPFFESKIVHITYERIFTYLQFCVINLLTKLLIVTQFINSSPFKNCLLHARKCIIFYVDKITLWIVEACIVLNITLSTFKEIQPHLKSPAVQDPPVEELLLRVQRYRICCLT